ncbi:Integrin alpha chain [Beggiatoa sp. SS]|nr:Integrin alpha chain [Beggiatoa sp. SS]
MTIETHFVIARYSPSGSDYTEMPVPSHTQSDRDITQTYVDTDLHCGTTYHYVISAQLNFSYTSGNTHEVSVTTPRCSTTTRIDSLHAGLSAYLYKPTQTVHLSASVDSDEGTVNTGTVTFTVKQGNQTIGHPVISETVTDGKARVNYTLPAKTLVGSYTIEAVYNAEERFASSHHTDTLTLERVFGLELNDVAKGIGGFVINGIEVDEYSRISVSGAKDVNGDGLNDLIIGAASAGAKYTCGKNGTDRCSLNLGESYVVFGKPDTTAVDINEIVKGLGGFVISGISDSVSGAGDVNGDGLNDLIIGAPDADLNDKTKVGQSYVVFGKNNTTAIKLSEIVNGVGGFVINGIDDNDLLGESVSSESAGSIVNVAVLRLLAKRSEPL